ncbi:endolytic transglycosylase MltG [Candidatus Saccharibacteria bacterium]|nr:endolytic transglycosylase MltG [Candidatus Saccharibacteria bacterium]
MQIASQRHNRALRPRKPIKLILLVIVLALLSIVGLFVWWYKGSLAPLSQDSEACKGVNGCPVQSFLVPEGASVSSISKSLEEAGLIRSATAFRLYMLLEGRNLNLKAGSYQLSTHWSAQEIAERFNQGALAQTFRITFLPGDTLAASYERLQRAGYSPDEIDAAFAKDYDYDFLKSRPAGATLEGYIYGDTYECFSTDSVEDILKRTFDKFAAEISQNNLLAGFQAQGLSFHEAVTLASIIQRESGSLSSDMPQVAQVFLLRLKKGIPLGSDAVIAYRADQLNPSREKTDMSYLKTVTCPWNSRSCEGMPPSPIAHPGLAALKAVAAPATGKYLYFLTGDDGKMYYAETEAEHNANASAHCKELCRLL